jgi:hypothetical protein
MKYLHVFDPLENCSSTYILQTSDAGHASLNWAKGVRWLQTKEIG